MALSAFTVSGPLAPRGQSAPGLTVCALARVPRSVPYRRSRAILRAADASDAADDSAERADDDIGVSETLGDDAGRTDSNGNDGGDDIELNDTLDDDVALADANGNDGDDLGGTGSGRGGGGDDRDEGDDEDAPRFELMAVPLMFLNQTKDVVLDKTFAVGTRLQDLLGRLAKLPGPYIAFLTALMTTFINQSFKRQSESASAIKSDKEKLAARRAAKANELRLYFETYSHTVLNTAARLAERLYILGSGNASSYDSERESGALYTTYLLAQFLSSVQIMRKEHPSLNFGRPSADRLFSNLLRRVQDAMDGNLAHILRSSRFYENLQVDDRLAEGFHVSKARQQAIGELMRQSRWRNLELGIGAVSSGGTGIEDRIISFPDFVELYQSRADFYKWVHPIVVKVNDMGKACTLAVKRTGSVSAARLSLLQSALMDVVDFLDPEPRAAIFHIHRRRRLVGTIDDALEMPPSMKKLYSDTAALMSGNVKAVASLEPTQAADCVHMYTRAPVSSPSTRSRGPPGDDPFAQMITWYMLEAGIPFQTTTLNPGRMPLWYLNLHPRGVVPVIEHGDHIIEDPSSIVDYLDEAFPDKTSALPQCSISDGLTARKLSRFRRTFYSWLKGRGRGRNYRTELTEDLIDLNDALLRRSNFEDGPFFGGGSVCRADMAILPHLQRLSVAGPELKRFSIPETLTAVHSYLKAATSNENFVASTPSDQTVLDGYEYLAQEQH